MTTQSMTGFGKAESESADFRILVELKSVNNRYLEAQFRLPRTLQELEVKLRGILEKNLSRGSVSCFVQFDKVCEDENGELELDETLAASYVRMIEKIQKLEGNISHGEVNPIELLKLPDVLKHRDADEKWPMDILEPQLVSTFQQACDALVEMRTGEGARMVKDIGERIALFTPWLEEIEKLLPERQKDYMSKIKAHVQELAGEDIVMNEERVVTEMGILGEKLDVTEELVRFRSHLKLFGETIGEAAPGKKLGFILQEMLREVNTMGTKCQFAPIQHLCVSMKEEVEKIREQVLNLE